MLDFGSKEASHLLFLTIEQQQIVVVNCNDNFGDSVR